LSSGNVNKYNKAADLGLWETWAYHCIRCNYLWFPKDFDFRGDDKIFDMEPPKACARCKSKYWNKIPQRETKNSDEMLSLARLRAIRRQKDKQYIQ
jgi:hypothetical protein